MQEALLLMAKMRKRCRGGTAGNAISRTLRADYCTLVRDLRDLPKGTRVRVRMFDRGKMTVAPQGLSSTGRMPALFTFWNVLGPQHSFGC
jgi:hypothetical protein